jgi:VWFA-related protein
MRRAILLGLTLAPLAAQTPLIRTETRLVLVDSVVTDKQGQPLGDLTPKDFRVWEDGKEQPVRGASFGAASYVVLLFDNPGLDAGGATRARQAAARFVDANAGAGHWMAIADFDGAMRTTQNFTSDAERLKRVLLESEPVAGGMSPAGRVAFSRQRIAGAEQSNQAERNLTSLGQGLRELARNLANVPGRKVVILFSASVLVNQASTALSTAGSMFNRWNVSLYPVNGAEGDLPAPFYGLAKITGGFVSANSHDLDRELTRIRAEAGGYYTLSYAPAETPDGSCHGLRVKVERPGAEVRARNVYCNVKAVDLLAGTAAEKEMESRAAGDQAGNLTASLQLPYFYSEPGLARLHMAMEIPGKGIEFAHVKGKLHAEVQILAIALQPDGREGARFSDTLKLDFARQEEVDALLKKPLHYEGQFEVASGQYTVKVVLSTGGENFGKLEAPLQIEPFDGKRLMLSGLALSKDVRSLADPAEGQDAQLLEGVTPLIFQDLRLVPSGDAWVRKSDTAAIYGEVYAPAPVPVELRLRVVDAATGKVSATGTSKVESFRPGEFATIPFALKLNPAALGAGKYRAEVELVAPDAPPVRSLSFEVK